tara:strand:+ start:8692 stop:9660 length:969 start_codon:yes stop_codon:yes gene_type:complete
MSSCAIIIPAVKESNLMNNCIKSCLNQSWEQIKVYVVLDILPKKKIKNSKLIYLLCPGHISKKRNFAANIANEDFLAFIDSDAYPEFKWIENGIKFFEKNKDFSGLLTGPDLAFPNEKGFEKVLSYVNKSYFISGSKKFRKNLNTKSKFVSHASSCNMLLQKVLFDKIGGMDEDIYVGEDIAFCDKIKKYKNKIYFLNNLIIYHKTRSLIPFFAQRFVYGTSVISSFKHSGIIKNFEFFIPFFIVVIPLIIIIFFNEYFLFNLKIYFLFSLFVFAESLYISNIKNFILVYIIILISTVLFGTGTAMSFFLNIKKIKKIYLIR